MRRTGLGLFDLGLLEVSWLLSVTHSSQMYTPGPATSVPTSVYAFRQKEKKRAALQSSWSLPCQGSPHGVSCYPTRWLCFSKPLRPGRFP